MKVSLTELITRKILATAILEIDDIVNVEIDEAPSLIGDELQFLLYDESDNDVNAVLPNYSPVVSELVLEYRNSVEGSLLRGRILCLLQKLTT